MAVVGGDVVVIFSGGAATMVIENSGVEYCGSGGRWWLMVVAW